MHHSIRYAQPFNPSTIQLFNFYYDCKQKLMLVVKTSNIFRQIRSIFGRCKSCSPKSMIMVCGVCKSFQAKPRSLAARKYDKFPFLSSSSSCNFAISEAAHDITRYYALLIPYNSLKKACTFTLEWTARS